MESLKLDRSESSSPVLLTESEIAKTLNISVASLREARRTGNIPSTRGRLSSPPFVKLGRLVRYPRKALDEWLSSYPLQTSIQDPTSSKGHK